MARTRELVTCQRIIYAMLFSCFIIDGVIKANIGIAIVKMVERNSSDSHKDKYRYDWNEGEKNEILGSFYWGYMLTPILGGRLAEIYGTRIVLGTSMLLTGLLTVITPFACDLGLYWIIMVRVISGLLLGVIWSSVHPMATKWAENTESSVFMQNRMSVSLGLVLSFSLSGYLVDRFDWPSVFYMSGTMLLIWSLLWFYLIYDSPDQHPRISKEEKDRLEKQISIRNAGAIVKQKPKWRTMLTCKPVWAIIVANACALFSIIFMITELPSYMNDVLHFSIKDNGLLSSLPHLMRYLISLISCHVADRLRKQNTFSTTSIRKFFTIAGFSGGAFLYLIQSIWGYDRVLSVIVLTVSFGCLGFTSAGFLPNSNDISPTYCGTIFGLANTAGSLSGYLSTKVVGLFTKDHQNFQQWRYVFLILVGVNVFGSVFYFIFASGEVQPWNFDEEDIEMENLKRDSRAEEAKGI